MMPASDVDHLVCVSLLIPGHLFAAELHAVQEENFVGLAFVVGVAVGYWSIGRFCKYIL